MLKITKTYEDFNGVERTEDFYFNLTKADLAELEMSVNGGLTTLLNNMSRAKDGKSIIEYSKKLVLTAYGEKSLDGREHYKSDEIRAKFAATQAYSDIFMEVATNDKKAAEFVMGILPKDIREEAMKDPSVTEALNNINK